VADAVLNLCMVQLLGHYRRFVKPPIHNADESNKKGPRDECLHPRFDDAAFFDGAALYAQVRICIDGCIDR